MKRTKLLLSTVVSLLLALVMVFAVACNPSGGTNQGSVRPAPEVPEKPAGDLGITQGSANETKSLLGIEIAVYPKTEYQIGETFDSEGISVRATYLDSTIAPDPLDPNANLVRDFVSATVDSSNFDSSKVGVYTIYVSYTYLGVTRMTSYTVSVAPATPAYGGIVAKLATGKSDTYSLSAGSTSVTINKDILAVYAIGTDGEPEATALDAELYDADLYLGTKKITDNAATENGVYSFVATLKADKSQQDFIPVYVVNTVSSIELIEGVGTFEQVEGNDKISSTWTFKVTYSNGATKTVKKGDAGLTIELDTTVVGEGKTANVTYVENDAKGTPHQVTTTVTYKITEKPVVEGPSTSESFLVENVGSAEAFTETSYAAGTNITDNSLFTLGATVAMKTALGKEYGSLQASGNAVSFTNRAGATVNPDNGIKLADNVAANAEIENILTVTAKETITLRLYVAWANDSYNSNRNGSLYYSVNGGEKQTKTIAKRTEVWVIEIELEANEVLTLGALNTHGDNSKLWLFGAEAKTV